MKKAFKYRLFTSKKQSEDLSFQLSEAARLYNAALQERRDAYQINKKSLNYYDQANQLKEIRANGDLSLANFSCCQDILRRVDKTFKAFFNRVKRGDKAGFPRFKAAKRFDSITFPSYGDGIKLTGNKLKIQGVGQVKVKLHRAVKGTIKTITIKRECGKWYVCFSVECENELRPLTGEQVGMDAGIESFMTLSDGTQIDNFKYFEASQKQLRRAGRKVARRKKGSTRRRKAVVILQKVHAKIRNQRTDFHHQVSRLLVNSYDLMAIEDLNIKALSKGILAKQVNDVAWSSFFNKLEYKAECAGKQVIRVNPNGTSQTCTCGERVKKKLSVRWHECLKCGVSNHRDIVSSQVILNRALGLSVASLTKTTGLRVDAEAALL